MSNFYPCKGYVPVIDETAFIAPGSRLIGDVTVGENSSIWHNAVLRGDCNAIVIGKKTNIQDNCIVHSSCGSDGERSGGFVASIGDYVTVGHGAIVHACTVEDYCLIGMGAVILDGAVVGKGSIVGSGAVVTKDSIIPPFSLVLGMPAKIIKTLDESSLEERIKEAQDYNELGVANKISLEEAGF